MLMKTNQKAEWDSFADLGIFCVATNISSSSKIFRRPCTVVLGFFLKVSMPSVQIDLEQILEIILQDVVGIKISSKES